MFRCLMRKKLLKLLWRGTYSIVNVLRNLTPFLQTSVFILGSRFYEYPNQFFLATDKHLHNLELMQRRDDK